MPRAAWPKRRPDRAALFFIHRRPPFTPDVSALAQSPPAPIGRATPEATPMKPSFLAAAAAATLLGACTTMPPTDDTPGKAPGLCNATTLGWTVGKVADQALVEKAHAESGAKVVRVLRPGQMVTMEYSDQRLNLRVDANNVVEGYSCS
jgi:hypothetical protein